MLHILRIPVVMLVLSLELFVTPAGARSLSEKGADPLLDCEVVLTTWQRVRPLFGQAPRQDAAEDFDESGEENWVADIRPGVKLYGRRNRFAEVGPSIQFDLAPDSRTIAFAVKEQIKFWDIESQKVVDRIQLRVSAIDLNYSVDGRKLFVTHQPLRESLLSGEPNPLLSVWNLKTLRQIAELQRPGDYGPHANYQVRAVAPSGELALLRISQPPGKKAYESRFAVYRIESGERVAELAGVDQGLFVFVNNGKQLVDHQGNAWDVETGQKLEERMILFRDRGSIFYLTANPRGTLVAGAVFGDSILLYNLDNQKWIDLQSPDRPAMQMFPIEFSNDGKLMAAGSSFYQPLPQKGLDFFQPARSQRSRIFVWDTESGKLVSTINTRGGHLGRIRFMDDQRLMTQTRYEYGVTEYDIQLKPEKKAGELAGSSSPIRRVHFFDRQNAIITSSIGDPVLIFDLESGRPEHEIHFQDLSYLDATTDGRHVVVGGQTLAVYDTVGKSFRDVESRLIVPASVVELLSGLLSGRSSEFMYESLQVDNVTVSDDNRYILMVARGNRFLYFQKFEIATGKLTIRKKISPKNLWGNQFNNSYLDDRRSAISKDGRWLAVADDHGDTHVVDIESGELRHTLKGAGGYGVKLYSIPETDLLMVVGKQIAFWDVESGEEKFKNNPLRPDFQLITVSSCGTRLALISSNSSGNQKLEVHELDELSGPKPIYSERLKQRYHTIGISRHGDRIAITRGNGNFEIWELDELVE